MIQNDQVQPYGERDPHFILVSIHPPTWELDEFVLKIIWFFSTNQYNLYNLNIFICG